MWDLAAGSDSTVVRILVHYEKLPYQTHFLIQINHMPYKRSLESSLLCKKNENGEIIYATEKNEQNDRTNCWRSKSQIKISSSVQNLVCFCSHNMPCVFVHDAKLYSLELTEIVVIIHSLNTADSAERERRNSEVV